MKTKEKVEFVFDEKEEEAPEEEAPEEKQEVATKPEAEVATTHHTGQGIADNVDSEDMMLGHIHQVQAMSHEFLKDPDCDCKVGDYICTVTREVLGTNEKPLEVMFLKYQKMIRLVALEDGKVVSGGGCLGYEPWNAAAREKPQEGETEYGQKFRRDPEYRFWVIRPGHEYELPMIFSCRRTKINLAKEILTICTGMQRLRGLDSWGHVFILTSVEGENKNKKVFQIPRAKPGRATTEEERKVARYWYNELTKNEHKYNPGDEATGAQGGDALDGDEVPW